jgi:capsular polysaccharide biosynthesis protein/Mrp family chromosome partitioning ATPase
MASVNAARSVPLPLLLRQAMQTGQGLILTAAVIMAYAASLYTIRNPTYTASSRLLLEPAVSLNDVSRMGGVAAESAPVKLDLQVSTEVTVLQSPVVADLVARRLRLAMPPDQLHRAVVASAVTDSVIEVQAVAANDRLAVELANGFADQYLVYRRRAATRILSELSRDLQARSSQLDKRIRELNEQLAPFEGSRDGPSVSGPSEGAARGERDRLVSTREVVASQAAAVQALVSQKDVGGGDVIARAAVPDRSPAPATTAAAGLALGAILGGMLALLRRQFERPEGGREEVEHVSGLPVLATVPPLGEPLRSRLGFSPTEPVTHHRPESDVADAYGRVYGILSTQGLGTSIRRVLITCVRRRVGEAAAANLAVACARAGLATLAISVDDDPSSLYALLDLSGKSRPTDASRHTLGWFEGLTITRTRNLAVLDRSQADGDQAELLRGPRLEGVLDEAAALFDIILVVAPPVAADLEAASLAEGCDAAFLVVAASDLDWGALVSASQTLRLATAKPCGVILTDVPDAEIHR